MKYPQMVETLKSNIKKATSNQFARSEVNYDVYEIIEMIKSDTLVIPPFQRDLVWTVKQKADLLNYLINGFAKLHPICLTKVDPLDTISLYYHFDSGDEIEDKPEAIDNVCLSVIDGLQRLTTLWQMTTGHQDAEVIYFNSLYYNFSVDARGKQSNFCVPAHLVLHEDRLASRQKIVELLQEKELKEDLAADILDLCLEVRRRIYNYQVGSLITRHANIYDQIQQFKWINRAGTKLSPIQTGVSRIMSEGWDFHGYCNEFTSCLEDAWRLTVSKQKRVSVPTTALSMAFYIIQKHTGKNLRTKFPPSPNSNKDYEEWGDKWPLDLEPGESLRRIRLMEYFTLAGLKEVGVWLLEHEQHIKRPMGVRAKGNFSLSYVMAVLFALLYTNRLTLIHAFDETLSGHVKKPDGINTQGVDDYVWIRKNIRDNSFTKDESKKVIKWINETQLHNEGVQMKRLYFRALLEKLSK